MSDTEKRSPDLRFLPRALGAWLICAAALLLCAAVLYASNAVPLSKLGYGSSVISFFAAFGAGLAACFDRRDQRVLFGLLTACCLTALLLLAGFLIRGRIESGAALSVVSFTLSGCLLGAMLQTKKRRGGRFRSGKAKQRRFS